MCNETHGASSRRVHGSDRNTNTEFELRGFNHIALVARDMAETVAWYEDKLGMKLVKTLGSRVAAASTSSSTWATASTGSPSSGSRRAGEGTPGDAIHPTYDDNMQRIGTGGGGSRRSGR